MLIYGFHGLGGSPTGSIKLLTDELRKHLEFDCICLALPHRSGKEEDVAKAHAFLGACDIPADSILIGISAGGFAAAKFQESRPDLKVIAISTPTRIGGMALAPRSNNFAAIYSKKDPVIKGRAEWEELTDNIHLLPWSDHNPDPEIDQLAILVAKVIVFL